MLLPCTLALCVLFSCGVSALPRQSDSSLETPIELQFWSMDDVDEPWGKMTSVGSRVQQLTHYFAPPENYTAGATVFAAFPTLDDPSR